MRRPQSRPWRCHERSLRPCLAPRRTPRQRVVGSGHALNWICRTCATQFVESNEPPKRCPICEDERQYVAAGGQQWTTPSELAPSRYVGFMWSYPNLIPLPAAEVLRIAAALEGWEFDRILGAWWDRLVPRDGNEVVRRSAERYAARVTSLA